MRIMVLGGDGYLGWPTAMHLASAGHKVLAVDNYLRRLIARSTRSVLSEMIETTVPHKANIDVQKIMPRVRWS